MLKEPLLIYWDSCVFLSYINDNPERGPTIAELLEQVGEKKAADKIVTSALARVEVACAASEKQAGELSPEVEKKLDALWEDSSVIATVEFHDDIARLARQLMRLAIGRGWPSLKPLDAIHLASAKFVGAREMQTYDAALCRYAVDIGCEICQPHVDQTKLPIDGI